MSEQKILYATMTNAFKVMRIFKSLVSAQRYATKRGHPVIGRMFEYARIDAVYRKTALVSTLASSYSIKTHRQCWELRRLKSPRNVHMFRGRELATEVFKSGGDSEGT